MIQACPWVIRLLSVEILLSCCDDSAWVCASMSAAVSSLSRCPWCPPHGWGWLRAHWHLLSLCPVFSMKARVSHVSMCLAVSSGWYSAVTTGLVHASSSYSKAFFHLMSSLSSKTLLSRLENHESQNPANLPVSHIGIRWYYFFLTPSSTTTLLVQLCNGHQHHHDQHFSSHEEAGFGNT